MMTSSNENRIMGPAEYIGFLLFLDGPRTPAQTSCILFGNSEKMHPIRFEERGKNWFVRSTRL
jgi:hypothetical protein